MLRAMCVVSVLMGAATAKACDHAQVQVAVPAAVVSPFAIVPQVLTAPLIVAADGVHSAAVTVVAAAPLVVERQRPVIVRSRTVVRGGLLSRVLRR